jgi:ribonucleoside-diphosphate reductase alpha chain
MNNELFEELSLERKKLQEKGLLPNWYTTGGWQLLKAKYLKNGETPLDRYKTIAKSAASYLPDSKDWEKRFFNVLWSGWLSPSTPVLANMGSIYGTPVSCSGTYIGDSVYSFYERQVESAVLSQNGFGTSAYLGDIRPRGSNISGGGKASGIVPVLKDYVQMSNDVSQGNQRRGSWAGYIPIEHADFWEIADYLFHFPDSVNIGWIVSKKFKNLLDTGDEDAIKRYQRVMKIRSVHGKGYLWKDWVVNRLNPLMYKDRGFHVKASNLCSETALFSNEDFTFSCVLSSNNLYKYDEWKDTDSVFVSTVFLDCVAEEFIRKARNKPGMERVLAFTEKSRALGLGVMGLHSLFQKRGISFESFEAHQLNTEIFKHINDETLRASKWMAEILGEPEWCKGYGVRNTHRIAIAPTMSTSMICGGVSQGIEPIIMNVYNQTTAGGEVYRISPELIEKMKQKNVYNHETIKDIEKNNGSVQHVFWLNDDEKQVFKTAFEIDQRAILRLASTRQRYVDQGQSLNLFFSSDESEEYISKITQEALDDEWIKALYYQRSMSGVKATRGECVACHG